MKRKNLILFLSIFLILSSMIYGQAGVDWTAATLNANFSVRHIHTLLSYDSKMWVIGGADITYPHKKDVWWSTNGVDWNEATGNAQFNERAGHGSVIFDNKMWVVGGEENGAYGDSVYWSTDGVLWNLAVQDAGFGNRASVEAIVYDNKIWVIGGYDGTSLNDVYWSDNGIDWNVATTNASFPGRANHAVTVYDDGSGEKMWVMGGINVALAKDLNDVWWSTNGVDWNEATSNAAFGPREGTDVVVFDNKMWLVGGYNPLYKDVWWSTDGANWNLANSNAFTNKGGERIALVHDNKMWVIGGGGGTYYVNDVWYSEVNTPTNTPTITPSYTPTSSGPSCPAGVCPGDADFVISEYLFEGSLVDSSGNNNHGYNNVTTGAVTFNTFIEGNPSNSLGNFEFRTGTGVTIPACPIYRSEGEIEWYQNVTQSADGYSNVPVGWYNFDDGTKLSIYTGDDELFGPNYMRFLFSYWNGSGIAFKEYKGEWMIFNQWQHIQWQWGSFGIRIVVDGVVVASDTVEWYKGTQGEEHIYIGTGSLIPGQEYSERDLGFYGYIDDLKFWPCSSHSESTQTPTNTFTFTETFTVTETFTPTKTETPTTVPSITSTPGEFFIVSISPNPLEIGVDVSVDLTVQLGEAVSSIDLHIGFNGWHAYETFGALGAGTHVLTLPINNDTTGVDIGYFPQESYIFEFDFNTTHATTENISTYHLILNYTVATLTPSYTTTIVETLTNTFTQTSTPTNTPYSTDTYTQTPTQTYIAFETPVVVATSTPWHDGDYDEDDEDDNQDIVDEDEEEDTECYPNVVNPGKDKELKIVFNVNKKSNVKVYVYTINGKLVDQFSYSVGETPNNKLYKVKLDVSKYTSGTYFYVIQGITAGGEKVDYKSKKFMIRKK